MSAKQKIIKELKSIFWTSLYFFIWFGGLMLIKVLLLREYHIEFYGFTIVLISALVMAKSVLLLEFIPISFTKNKPAWVEVFIRTLLYIIGVFIIIVLEKGLEAKHEYGGFFEAIKNIASKANAYHIWVNTICVYGALLLYNIWSVFKKHFGERVFWKIMREPMPE